MTGRRRRKETVQMKKADGTTVERKGVNLSALNGHETDRSTASHSYSACMLFRRPMLSCLLLTRFQPIRCLISINRVPSLLTCQLADFLSKILYLFS